MTAESSASHTVEVSAPPARFNFAQHLLEANAGRSGKTAFVDDAGTLTYGSLAERVRRLAAGLRGLGIRREERVLLLMQDGCDWPVSLLGGIYAGLVPVAVNTLLTADDYAYMLENSRAQAVLVSGALLPALTAAMTRSEHEVRGDSARCQKEATASASSRSASGRLPAPPSAARPSSASFRASRSTPRAKPSRRTPRSKRPSAS